MLAPHLLPAKLAALGLEREVEMIGTQYDTAQIGGVGGRCWSGSRVQPWPGGVSGFIYLGSD